MVHICLCMFVAKTEMASGERISEKLKLIDSKRNSMRDVILTLATEWKDLDEQLDSTQKYVQGTLDELRVRENNLELVLESVRQSNKEIEVAFGLNFLVFLPGFFWLFSLNFTSCVKFMVHPDR